MCELAWALLNELGTRTHRGHTMCVRACVYVCVHVCAGACVRVCVCMCVCMCVMCTCVCVMCTCVGVCGRVYKCVSGCPRPPPLTLASLGGGPPCRQEATTRATRGFPFGGGDGIHVGGSASEDPAVPLSPPPLAGDGPGPAPAPELAALAGVAVPPGAPWPPEEGSGDLTEPDPTPVAAAGLPAGAPASAPSLLQLALWPAQSTRWHSTLQYEVAWQRPHTVLAVLPHTVQSYPTHTHHTHTPTTECWGQ